jgi:hypothetical protein
MLVKKILHKIAFWLYRKTFDEYSSGSIITVAKRWSRKGNCPICLVSTGSNHNIECIYRKV